MVARSPVETLPAWSTFPAGSGRAPVGSPGVELAEVARRRRMVRSFSDVPVDPPTLHKVLQLARRAPSAGNAQGWEAVVLQGPAQTAGFWRASTTAAWRARSRRWPGLERAPVVVVIFSHPGAYLARYGEPDKAASGLGDDPGAWPVPYWDVDAGMAALLLLLGAVDAGLAACFLGNFRREQEVRQALGVPDDRRYLGAVLMGRPAADDATTTSARRPTRGFEEVFHRGRW